MNLNSIACSVATRMFIHTSLSTLNDLLYLGSDNTMVNNSPDTEAKLPSKFTDIKIILADFYIPFW